MKNIKIPYEDLREVNRPYFDELTNSSKKIIENGWYILGNEVLKFEENFSKLHNNHFCIGVASGLDALILGLSVFNFKKGSKVLVPSNTYIATILAIIKCDLIPILVEPNIETYNIDVKSLENSFNEECVAIITVHMYGRIAPMDEIMKFADKNKLIVIEDCAQSHFAEICNKRAGTFGEIGAFSFYPSKNLGSLGDSGAIICKDFEIYKKLKALRNYGSHKKYHNDFLGLNSRLDEIQASFLNVKLPYINEVIIHKNKLANIYLTQLKDIKEIKLPKTPTKNEHVWHIFNILLDKRDELKDLLLQEGVGTEIHYPIAPHLQNGYLEFFKNQNFSISEYIHLNTLSLPISTCHTETNILDVCNLLKKCINKLYNTTY